MDLCESFSSQNGFRKIGTGYFLQLVDFFPYERNFENGRLFFQIGLIKVFLNKTLKICRPFFQIGRLTKALWTENWKRQTIPSNRQKDWNFAKSGFLIFFVGKGQAIFVRKGGGFKKSKAAGTGLTIRNRIKDPKKEIIKRWRLTKKNQNQTENFVPKETYDLNPLPRRENCR